MVLDITVKTHGVQPVKFEVLTTSAYSLDSRPIKYKLCSTYRDSKKDVDSLTANKTNNGNDLMNFIVEFGIYTNALSLLTQLRM